jgi:hypothetical protein
MLDSRSPSDVDRLAEDGLAELEKCLKSVTDKNAEEEEAVAVIKREAAVSLQQELASLEGMDITTDNKIDIGKAAGLNRM